MGGAHRLPEGLVTAKSDTGPTETLRRLESGLSARGLTIFARIDHAEGARGVGMELPPTVVLIFGSPKSGTPLMQVSDTIGLDLPLKMLIRQDADGKTWLAWDDPVWIARRHGVDAAAQPIVGKMQALLAAIAADASGGAG